MYFTEYIYNVHYLIQKTLPVRHILRHLLVHILTNCPSSVNIFNNPASKFSTLCPLLRSRIIHFNGIFDLSSVIKYPYIVTFLSVS